MPQHIEERETYRSVNHHTRDEQYARVHSNRLDSGTVTIGLSTITDSGSKVETTVLYLTPELANALATELALR